MNVNPITAFVGPNGSGKTLAMVEYGVLPRLSRRRIILGNITIFASPDDAHLPAEERRTHPQWRPLKSWRQIDGTMTGVVLLLDEISSMFDSRESGKMPTQITTRLQQLRKKDNCIFWTAPDWDRCDKVLRHVTNNVVLCSGLLPKKVMQEWQDPDDPTAPVEREAAEWGSARIMRYKRYNRASFDEFRVADANSDKKGSLRSIDRSWYRRERHQAQHMYDTYEQVDLLDHLDQYGTCIDCGGSRRRPACSC